MKFSERQKTPPPPPPSPPANALYSRLRITSNATMPIKLRPQALGECQLANFSLGEQSTKSEARSTERSTLFNHDRVPSIAGRFAFIRPRFAVTKGIRVLFVSCQETCRKPIAETIGSGPSSLNWRHLRFCSAAFQERWQKRRETIKVHSGIEISS